MAHEFVTSSNGWMEIDSEPGRGTSVRLFFPVVNIADDHAGPRLAKADEGFDRAGARILIVDAQEELARTISEQLKVLGYQSDWAADPVQLMDQVEMVGRHDVVVTEVWLGGISGKKLYEHFQHVLGDRCPKVIFMSGAGTADAPGEDVDFLRKPFNILALDRRLIDSLK